MQKGDQGWKEEKKSGIKTIFQEIPTFLTDDFKLKGNFQLDTMKQDSDKSENTIN